MFIGVCWSQAIVEMEELYDRKKDEYLLLLMDEYGNHYINTGGTQVVRVNYHFTVESSTSGVVMCPVCYSEDVENYNERVFDMKVHEDFSTTDLAICRNCGNVFIPTKLAVVRKRREQWKE